MILSLKGVSDNKGKKVFKLCLTSTPKRCETY